MQGTPTHLRMNAKLKMIKIKTPKLTNNKKIAFSNPFNNAGSTTEAKTLPRPSFMVQQGDLKFELIETEVENLVFKNPFRVKEDQKKAVLERH